MPWEHVHSGPVLGFRTSINNRPGTKKISGCFFEGLYSREIVGGNGLSGFYFNPIFFAAALENAIIPGGKLFFTKVVFPD